MDLFDQVLQGIPNQRPLLERMGNSDAVCALVDEYNRFSRTLFSVPPLITGLNSGREFKDALRLLEPDAQLQLLSKYSDVLHQRNKPPTEPPERVEERRHRHWMVKAAFLFSGAGFFLISGAVVALAYKAGKVPDGAVVSSITKPAVEIAKLIFQVGVK